jgi:restriction system protein
MNNLKLSELNDEIDRFANESESINPIEAERRLLSILTPLLEADGYSVKHIRGPSDNGIDYLGEKIDDENKSPFILGIQYKHRRGRRLVGAEEVRSLVGASLLNNLSRAVLLVNTGFTASAISVEQRNLPTAVELLDLNALKAWVSRIERSIKGGYSKIVAAIIDLSKQCAHLIANDPTGLDDLEWRDIERMLAEVFEGLGFEVTLTPGSKDGGKDLILECIVRGKRKSYVVEVKHWRSRQRVGKGYINDFVKVVAKEQHEGGLYLATYGYSSDAFEALTKVERDVIKFGVDKKIVSLCRTYVKAESGIWSTPSTLPDLIFDEAI